jgi:uncharacterized Zn finger protein
MKNHDNLPILFIPRGTQHLPDNQQWTNRLEIKSETSNRLYIIAQNKDKRHWGCSCPGYKIHRRCKHLAALQLPAGERPYEVQIGG